MFSKVADFIIIVTMLAGFYVFSAIGFASMSTKNVSYDRDVDLLQTERFEEPMTVKVKRNAL